MNARHRTLWISLAAAAIEAVASLSLLAVSIWFICACAVVGSAGSAIAFNYIAPATVIRVLAIVRVAAGYGEKYFGHLVLLDRLATIRRQLLVSVLSAGEGPEHARATAALQQASEDVAARYTAVIAPQGSAALLLAGFLLTVVMIDPRQLWPLGTVSAGLLVGRQAILLLAGRLIQRREVRAAALDRSLARWLRSASLWSLRPDWQNGAEPVRRAIDYARSRRQVESLVSHVEALLLITGLLAAAVSLQLTLAAAPTPLLIVPMLVMASLRDWMRPGLQAVIKQEETVQRSALLMSTSTRGLPPQALLQEESARATPEVSALVLDNFRWVRGEHTGPALSAHLSIPGLVLISGQSGIGKTSLLLALVGELPYRGRVMWQPHIGGDKSTTRRLFYLAEQFPAVLSDTLEHNLRMASPAASIDELQQALRWSELVSDTAPVELSQWLGAQGRILSGGERKRLALARAYLSQAPIWLLDEPFEGLDDDRAQQLSIKLNEAAASRLIIIVSHRHPQALRPDQCLSVE